MASVCARVRRWPAGPRAYHIALRTGARTGRVQYIFNIQCALWPMRSVSSFQRGLFRRPRRSASKRTISTESPISGGPRLPNLLYLRLHHPGVTPRAMSLSLRPPPPAAAARTSAVPRHSLFEGAASSACALPPRRTFEFDRPECIAQTTTTTTTLWLVPHVTAPARPRKHDTLTVNPASSIRASSGLCFASDSCPHSPPRRARARAIPSELCPIPAQH